MRGRASLKDIRSPSKVVNTAGLFLFASFALLAGNVFAGTSPRIACNEPEYQFDERANTGVVEHVFLVENRGDAPLQIGSVRACCGTGASIATNEIAPHTNTALVVSVSIGGIRGPVQKTFYIGSNDPSQPYLQLRVIGTATADAYLEPGSVNFGDVRLGEKTERTVKLQVSQNLALSITNITVDTNQFAATWNKTDDGYCVTVRTVPPLKAGVNQGNMRILTDSREYGRFDVHLSATLASDIIVVPQEIVLIESVGKVEAVTRYVAIRSKSNSPFKIVKVEPPEPGIEVKVDSLPSSGYRIEMKNILPFPELDGKRFVVRTDSADCWEIAIPVRVSHSQ